MYLEAEELEERIWQQYLHTSMELSFTDFKKQVGYKPLRKSKKQLTEAVSDEEEKERLENVSRFIKFKREEDKLERTI